MKNPFLEQAEELIKECHNWDDWKKEAADIWGCEQVVLFCHSYKDGVGKYSYGVGYPKCTIRDKDIIYSEFIGDKDEPFYKMTLQEKIIKRLKK